MLEANMSNHKFNSDGNGSRVVPTSGYVSPSMENRGEGPRILPTPKPAPAPPKQK